jgi:hypothetical protein
VLHAAMLAPAAVGGIRAIPQPTPLVLRSGDIVHRPTPLASPRAVDRRADQNAWESVDVIGHDRQHPASRRPE